MKIAVFDSGVGGITVLNHLKTQFPTHEFFYFGDNANVPYGTKSVAQIQALCTSAAERIRFMKPDLCVVACNTASSLALTEIRTVLDPIPVLGVVEAGVATVTSLLKSAVASAPAETAPVLILGTKATVKSHVYANHLKAAFPSLQVFEQACPLLVPMIEEGWVDHSLLHQTVNEYVKAYLPLVPGIALLACTHYPWIHAAFVKALPHWRVIDSSVAVAEQLIAQWKFQATPQNALTAASSFKVSWFFSDPDSVNDFVQIQEVIQKF